MSDAARQLFVVHSPKVLRQAIKEDVDYVDYDIEVEGSASKVVLRIMPWGPVDVPEEQSEFLDKNANVNM